MRNSTIVVCVSILLCAFAMADDKPREMELLKDYHGEVQLPADLYDAYAAFIKAIETADQGTIQIHCLPHSVTFTTGVRSGKQREYASDINIPFIRQVFNKYILVLRKVSEDTYLIRTGSSAMWFVRTKSEGWKLYSYSDKAIK